MVWLHVRSSFYIRFRYRCLLQFSTIIQGWDQNNTRYRSNIKHIYIYICSPPHPRLTFPPWQTATWVPGEQFALILNNNWIRKEHEHLPRLGSVGGCAGGGTNRKSWIISFIVFSMFLSVVYQFLSVLLFFQRFSKVVHSKVYKTCGKPHIFTQIIVKP